MSNPIGSAPPEIPLLIKTKHDRQPAGYRRGIICANRYGEDIGIFTEEYARSRATTTGSQNFVLGGYAQIPTYDEPSPWTTQVVEKAPSYPLRGISDRSTVMSLYDELKQKGGPTLQQDGIDAEAENMLILLGLDGKYSNGFLVQRQQGNLSGGSILPEEKMKLYSVHPFFEGGKRLKEGVKVAVCDEDWNLIVAGINVAPRWSTNPAPLNGWDHVRSIFTQTHLPRPN